MRQIALPSGDPGAKSCSSFSFTVIPSSAARAASTPGARGARVYAVDGDSVAAQVVRQGLGHVHQGHVPRSPAEISSGAGIGAADIDNAAPSLLLQKGNGSPGAAQRPTYFTSKSYSKSSSLTVSMGPVAVDDPPG